MPTLASLHGLIRALRLDLLDLDELLRLYTFKPMVLRLFRATCRIEGKLPMTVLEELIIHYIYHAKENRNARRATDRNTE